MRMVQSMIPAEAKEHLEKGNILGAVQATAATNPHLRRLEVCALLGEAVTANPFPAIPIARPLSCEQDLASLHKSSSEEGLPSLFPNSSEKDKLRKLPNNRVHQEHKGDGSKMDKAAGGGCCLFFSIGAVLMFFYPGWGLISIGVSIFTLMYFQSKSTVKEEDELDMIKSAEPIYPNQAQTGAWNVVTGRVKCESPITSVVAEEALAYVQVIVQKMVQKEITTYPEDGPPKVDRWYGLKSFHARCELHNAWLEANEDRINLIESDYESLAFLEIELPDEEIELPEDVLDDSEQALKAARKGRGESGLKTRRLESHTARAFLLDDGLHVANPETITANPPVQVDDRPPVLSAGQEAATDVPPVISDAPPVIENTQGFVDPFNPEGAMRMNDQITVTSRCYALDDDVWAAGYIWEDEAGGKNMGAHLYKNEVADSNVLFLTDQDWQNQIAASEAEVSSAATKMYISFAVAAVFLLLGALVIILDWGPEISGWFRALAEE